MMMIKIILYTLFPSLSLKKCEQTVRSRTLKYRCELNPLQYTLPTAHDNKAPIPDLENHKATVTGTCFFLQSFLEIFHVPCSMQNFRNEFGPAIKNKFGHVCFAFKSLLFSKCRELGIRFLIFLATTIRHVHTKTFVFL